VSDLVWIDERDALALHGRLLALYGGAPGMRDAGLLESALARPRHLHAYADNPDLIQLAAASPLGSYATILLWMATSGPASWSGYSFSK
jgi:death on curing protein